MNLDVGLPVEKLRTPIRSLLADTAEGPLTLDQDAVNRRGRSAHCRVTIAQLRRADESTRGVILLIDAKPVEDEGSAP